MHIHSLHIYPIKSCAGIALESAQLLPAGFKHDRRWMLVDDTGKFMSQREHSKLALIKPSITETGLKLEAPGMAACDVAIPVGTAQVSVTVWKSTLTVPVAHDAVNAWLTQYMGMRTRLVYLDDESKRAVTSSRGKPGDVVSFADGFPLLLTTTASLKALNDAMESAVPMDRFRPNIVIEGASEAWAEDTWRMLQVGDITLENMKPCARCIMTQIDQTTGEIVDKEPIRTLRKLRFSPEESGVLFGVNITARSLGEIKVGQVVEITSTQEPVTVLKRA